MYLDYVLGIGAYGLGVNNSLRKDAIGWYKKHQCQCRSKTVLLV